MRMKVSNYIAKLLVQNGITDVFMITGGGAMHLDDGLGHEPGLHCVYNHHEQACAIAAESYARIHNRIAAVCVTTGPGGTNAITGVVGGWLDSIPMLVISGQVRYDVTARSTGLGIRAFGDQEYDICKSVEPMTKYCEMVIDPKRIRYAVEKALYLAQTGRPGPCWLDIPFLNSVVNLIYNMENQKLDRYVGDYDHFKEVHAVQKAQIEAAYNRQQQEIAQLKDFVARNKARVATRNMAMSRQKKLDRMDVIELAAEKPKPEFRFLYGRAPGRFLFTTEQLEIGYDRPLTKPLDLVMERGNRIVMVGANGIGKTTLLKSLLGLIKPYSGTVHQGDYLEIGYFEQETSGDNGRTCLEEIWQEFPSWNQYEVRSALAKCGLTTKHIESQVRVLSGGEQAKVRLCKLMNRQSNVLILDEPTNHLDADAKDSLLTALKEYKGSILMVCHEREFYEALGAQIWDCSSFCR